MRYLTDDRHVDQTNGVRMKVFAAGLPRCATSSIQAAFEEELGLAPCMHMAHVAPHAERLEVVLRAMNCADRAQRHKLLHSLFDGYVASADAPAALFPIDVMEMYPGMKVILNKRKSANAWVESFANTIGFFSSWTYAIFTFPVRPDRLHWQIHRSVPEYMRIMGFHGRPGFTAEYYDWHNESVRRAAKANGCDLLEWEPGMGWEPICTFLGRDVPSKPFPHRNETANITFLIRIMLARGILYWAAIFGGAWAAYKYVPWLSLPAVFASLLSRVSPA